MNSKLRFWQHALEIEYMSCSDSSNHFKYDFHRALTLGSMFTFLANVKING